MRHRLFQSTDENELDDEEDDEEFDQYMKDHDIKENSLIQSKPEEDIPSGKDFLLHKYFKFLSKVWDFAISLHLIGNFYKLAH